MAAVITTVTATTPESPVRPVRVVKTPGAPKAPKTRTPRHEGDWRGREESSGASVPAFRLDVLLPTPLPTPLPPLSDDHCLHCNISLALHAWTLPLCRKKDCEIDDCWCHIMHHELAILTNPIYVHYQKPYYGNPADEYLDAVLTNMCAHESWIPAEDTEDTENTWVIGNLDLDWADADPSWSHEEVAEAKPQDEDEDEEEEEGYEGDEDEDDDEDEDEDEVDEQELYEGLYDDYDGEHGEYPCDD